MEIIGGLAGIKLDLGVVGVSEGKSLKIDEGAGVYEGVGVDEGVSGWEMTEQDASTIDIESS